MRHIRHLLHLLQGRAPDAAECTKNQGLQRLLRVVRTEVMNRVVGLFSGRTLLVLTRDATEDIVQYPHLHSLVPASAWPALLQSL